MSDAERKQQPLSRDAKERLMQVHPSGGDAVTAHLARIGLKDSGPNYQSAPSPESESDDSKFNSWEVAKQFNAAKTPEEKDRIRASLKPWQEKIVEYSIESNRKLQDDLAAAKAYKGPVRSTLDVAKDYWQPKAEAVAGTVSQNLSAPGRADGYRASDFAPTNPATPDAEWRNAHVNRVDAENRDMQGRMENFRRDTVNALTPGESDLTRTNPELFNQDMPAGTARSRFGTFDPDKDPAAIARRMLNGN